MDGPQEIFDAMTSSEQALTHVREGSVVGLGTGHAATAFVRALGERVRGGLSVRGVATSEATGQLAGSWAFLSWQSTRWARSM